MSRIGKNQSIQPETGETEEYFLFHIPEKINLAAKSQIRNKFITENKLPYNKIYHISHSLSRFHRNIPAYKNNIPIFVRLELSAEDVGDFQIPGGTYKVYEKNMTDLTYIGAGSYGIAEGEDVIKLGQQISPGSSTTGDFLNKLNDLNEIQDVTRIFLWETDNSVNFGAIVVVEGISELHYISVFYE